MLHRLICFQLLLCLLVVGCSNPLSTAKETGPIQVAIRDTIKDVLFSKMNKKKQLDILERCILKNREDSIVYAFGRVMLEAHYENFSNRTIQLIENEQLYQLASTDRLDFFHSVFLKFHDVGLNDRDMIKQTVDLVISGPEFFGLRLPDIGDELDIIIDNDNRFDPDTTKNKKQ